MTLIAPQIGRLVSQIKSDWSLPGLTLAAADLGIALGDLAPGAGLEAAAFKLITELNAAFPPRDVELLRKLEATAPPAVRALATELRNPPYFPAGDPHDAELIGTHAFVNRDPLRKAIRDFTYANVNSPHVLIVRGKEPCGKSYSWRFLRHLAQAYGATAPRIDIARKALTPHELIVLVFQLLMLDMTRIPSPPDDPQLAKTDTLVGEFTGQIQIMNGQQRYWLIVDGLNSENATPAVLELVFALARAVQEILPDRLWLVLLGYNPPIEDPDLSDIAQEDARFPDPSCVATHFEAMAGAGGHTMTAGRAKETALALFQGHPKLDKSAMIKLTEEIEQLGQKIRTGAFQ